MKNLCLFAALLGLFAACSPTRALESDSKKLGKEMCKCLGPMTDLMAQMDAATDEAKRVELAQKLETELAKGRECSGLIEVRSKALEDKYPELKQGGHTPMGKIATESLLKGIRSGGCERLAKMMQERMN